MGLNVNNTEQFVFNHGNRLIPMIAKRTQSEKIITFWRKWQKEINSEDVFDVSHGNNAAHFDGVRRKHKMRINLHTNLIRRYYTDLKINLKSRNKQLSLWCSMMYPFAYMLSEFLLKGNIFNPGPYGKFCKQFSHY